MVVSQVCAFCQSEILSGERVAPKGAGCTHTLHQRCLIEGHCSIDNCPSLRGRASRLDQSSDRNLIVVAIVIAGIFLAAVATYCYVRLTDSRDEADIAYQDAMFRAKYMWEDVTQTRSAD